VTLVIEPSEDGGFIAHDDDIRVVAQGDTEQEARDRFDEALRHLDEWLKGGEA
jgi:predicted RNase H-like HicB family nuclease